MTDWLAERFRQHACNADVVRQDLANEKDIHVSLRTVERAVAPLRRDLVIAARARGVRCLAFSTITNPAAGITGERLSHAEVIEVAARVAGDLERLVSGVVARLSAG